jgi:PBSX family phage portal protein
MALGKARGSVRKVRPLPPINPERVFRKTTRATNVRSLRLSRKGNTKELVPLLTIKRTELMDPFDTVYTASPGPNSDFAVLEPELPYGLLLKAAKGNSALNQCIDAYVVNIESYGYQLEFIGPPGKENLPRFQAEKNLALDFLDNCSDEGSLRQIRERRRRDIEYLGVGYLEIGRDIAGRPRFINHAPTVNLRKTKKDREATPYTRLVRSADGTVMKKEGTKRFRRYVQIAPNGGRVYFKEFGDPRSIDPKTGLVNANLAIENQATEIIEEELYSPGTRYGQPRWIGALADMLGIRESEIVNLNFFRENAIPAMAVLISGGALTEESYDRVVNVINAAKGSDAMNRIMILEAAADDSVGDADKAPPAPRIDMKPMINDRQSDGLFKEYQLSAKRKIRSSMRLPALYPGDTDEDTKATAQSGMRVAEGQVFAPERSKFDDFINQKILPSLGIVNWKFRTLGPSVYDPDTLSVMIDRFGRQGAMTPNILIRIANQVLDVQIPPVDDKWGDVPFTYTMGMVNQGMQLDGFEELFATIQEAVVAAPDSNTPANDNSGAAKPTAAIRKIKRELISLTDDCIRKINDAMDDRMLEAA